MAARTLVSLKELANISVTTCRLRSSLISYTTRVNQINLHHDNFNPKVPVLQLYQTNNCNGMQFRTIFTNVKQCQSNDGAADVDDELIDDNENKNAAVPFYDREVKGCKGKRVRIIDVATSIRYIKSKAYGQVYGSEPVWKPYRRNHKYAIPSKKTRKRCIIAGVMATGNPCPICRDEYLVPHETNVELLKQFICQHTGLILSQFKTGVCVKKQLQLQIAINRAIDHGYLSIEVPFTDYNYSDYYQESKATDAAVETKPEYN